MGSSKPKPVKAPFEQTQTNTFAPQSIAGTPEAQSYLNQPLDFGDPVNVDPGVARRTALAKQSAENRANSAFNFGVPRFIREANAAKEQRDIDTEGAYQMQQAEYANQLGNNQMRANKTLANLARYERLLPQILQTGGQSSGFNTQVVQPQPGFLQSLALNFARGAGAGLGVGG